MMSNGSEKRTLPLKAGRRSYFLFPARSVSASGQANIWKRLLSSIVSTVSSVAIAISPLVPARSGFADDLPGGGQVEAGSASLSTPSPDSLIVDQTSDRAVIGWDAFSVGPGNQVLFRVPTGSGATLNRVSGSMSSTIAGQIQSNGQLYLVNPNGILITPTGSVNTNAFVGSSLDVSNADFMAGKDHFVGKGSSADVVNEGLIRTKDGGVAVLMGGHVVNNGMIEANEGAVGLGAGEDITLDLTGDGLLSVTVPTKNANQTRALISQAGRIKTNGGRVEIKAATAATLPSAAIQVSGAIEADSVFSTGNGVSFGGAPAPQPRIRKAPMAGKGGTVIVDAGNGGSAEISARISADSATGEGGKVSVTGLDVALRGALVSATGATGGGSIEIGGSAEGKGPLANASTMLIDRLSKLDVSSTDKGNGGDAVVWSERSTDFRGSIDARGGVNGGDGGHVEVSGKARLAYAGAVDTLAPKGRTGNLLLDPYDVTISAGTDTNQSGFTATGTGSIINITTLQNALATSNVTVSTGASGAEAGDITVANAIQWSANTTLTLTAAGRIVLNAGITNSSTGSGLTLNAAGAGGISGTGTLANSGTLILNVADASGAGTLSGIISGTGSLTKTGAGKVTLSGANTYTGTTTISSGGILAGRQTSSFGMNSAVTVANGATLDLAGFNSTIGSLAGAGTVTNSGAAGLLVTLTAGGNNTSTTFSGVIQNGSGAIGLTKAGTGTLILTGSNTYAGSTIVSGGRLNLNPDVSNTIGLIQITGGAAGATLVISGSGTTTSSGTLSVGTSGADVNANVEISGNLTVPSFFIGNASGAIGTVTQTAGNVIVNGFGDPNFGVGQASGASGTYNMSGGTLTSGNCGSFFCSFNVGAFGSGTFNQSGGTVNSQGWTIIGRRVGGTGVYNLTGGTLNQTTPSVMLYVGEEGTGTLNVSGAGVVNAAGGIGISGGAGPQGIGTVNLLAGGTINTPLVQKNNGSNATFVFNGGLLQATGASAAFMTGITSTVIQSGGAYINDGGFSIVVGQTLTGSGALTKSGTGTLTLSGTNTWTGATTVSAGTLAAGSITAFGSNSAINVSGSATLDLAGFNNTIGSLAGAGTVTNSGAAATLTTGGDNTSTMFSGVIRNGTGTTTLTKTGTGTMILTGANTYTGATTVNGGTLRIGDGTAGSIASSSVVSTGAAATLALNLASGSIFANGIANAGAINFLQAGASTVSGIISGAGTLMQSGTGTTTLSGSNTYTGATTIGGGTLAIGATGRLGGGTYAGAVTLSGGNLTYGGSAAQVLSGTLTLSANATLTNTSTSMLTISNAVALGTSTLTLLGDGAAGGGGSQNLTISGVVSGTGATALIIGSGTAGANVVLSGANTFTGTVNLANTNSSQLNSILTITNSLALGAGNKTVSVNGGNELHLQNNITLGSNISFMTSGSAIQNGQTVNRGVIYNDSGNNAINGSIVAIAGVGTSIFWSSAGTLTFNGPITSPAGITRYVNLEGSGSIVVNGSLSSGSNGVMALFLGRYTSGNGGTYTFSGNNTYTGATNVYAGTLKAGSATAFGSNSAVTMSGGTTLDLAGFSNTIGSLTGAGTVTNSGAAATLTAGGDNTSTTFSGVIQNGTGTTNLVKTGTGTLTLSGANIYTGTTTISAGTLEATLTATSKGLGTGTVSIASGASLALNNANTTTTAVTLGNTFTGAGAIGLTFAAGTFGRETKMGGLSGFTGTLTLAALGSSGDKLNLQSNVGGSVVVGSGTTLFVTDLSVSVANGISITGAGNSENLGVVRVENLRTLTSRIALTGDATIGAAGSVGTLYGIVSGAFNLTKVGSGTLRMFGGNTYTGSTTVSAGTLAAGFTSAFGSNSAVTVASGATLDLAGVNSSVGSLSGNGIVTNSGAAATLTVGASNISTTFSGIIQDGSGTTSLFKRGTGTLTLSGANTYTGTTTVNGGTLAIGSGGSLGGGTHTGAVTLSGGNLTYSGSAAQILAGMLTLSANATLTNTSTSMLTISNTVALGGNALVLIGNGTGIGGGSRNITLSGVVSGTGATALIIGSGTAGANVVLSGANTFTGTVNLANTNSSQLNSILTITNSLALGAGNKTVSVNGGNELHLQNNITLGSNISFMTSGSAIQNGQTVNRGVIYNDSGNNAINGSIVAIAGVGYSIFWSSAGTLTFNGAIAPLSGLARTINLEGSGSIVVNGSLSDGSNGQINLTVGQFSTGGTFTVAGNNTYTGATNVYAGTLKAGSATAFGSNSAVTMSGGTTLDLAGFSNTIGSLTGAGTVTNSGAAATLTAGGDNTSTSFSGVIQNGTGTTALAKTGTGTMILTGANTYTGTTAGNGGILQIGDGISGSIASSSEMSTAVTGTLALNLVSGSTFSNTIANAGAVNLLQAGTFTVSGIISGAGSLTQSGTGTTTLSAFGSSLRDLTISGGTIDLSGSITGLSTMTIASGTALNLTGAASYDKLASADATWTIAGALNNRMTTGQVAQNLAATINLNGGTITGMGVTSDPRGDFSMSQNVVVNVTGTASLSGILRASNKTLTLNTASSSDVLEIGGLLGDDLSGGTLSLTKSGTGTVILSGANTHTGQTTVDAGTLTLTGSWNAGTGTVSTIVAAGATLNGTGQVTAGMLSHSGLGTLALISSNMIDTVAASGKVGSISLRNGKSLALGSIDGSDITIQTIGAMSDLTLNSGAVLSASGPGTALVLAAGGNFINNSGAGGIVLGATGSPNWQIYSTAPSGNRFNGLDSGNTAIWNTAYGQNLALTGNRYLFTYAPTVTFTSIDVSKTYGDDGTAAVAAAYTVSGVSAGVSGAFLADGMSDAFSGAPIVSSTGFSALTDVGSYAIAVTGGTLSALNGYNLAFSSAGNLTVTQRALTVTAEGKSMVYGNAVPALTYTLGGQGLVNGDTLTGALASAASSTSNVGTYGIGQGTLTAGGNYAITFAGANVSVTQRGLTVAAEGKSMVYGNAVPALTYTLGGQGLVNGDTLTGALASAASSTSNVGTYGIGQGTLTAGGNYAIAYRGAELSVIYFATPQVTEAAIVASRYIPAVPSTTIALLPVKEQKSGSILCQKKEISAQSDDRSNPANDNSAMETDACYATAE